MATFSCASPNGGTVGPAGYTVLPCKTSLIKGMSQLDAATVFQGLPRPLVTVMVDVQPDHATVAAVESERSTRGCTTMAVADDMGDRRSIPHTSDTIKYVYFVCPIPSVWVGLPCGLGCYPYS